MSYSNHITIGPEFFQKAFNDYENWQWAIIREFLQNSIDCGSKNIEVSILDESGPTTRLVVLNDGEPMTEDILVNKLLALGASGKNFQGGSVGGFGKAKEVLYLAHRSYHIHTGNLVVKGSGAGYDLTHSDTTLRGTQSTVILNGHYAHTLKNCANLFGCVAQWDGKLTVNCETLPAALKKGARRKELSCGTIYTNNSVPDTVIVRMHGIPMFVRSTPAGQKCVILELNGNSDQVLTANRDQLTYAHASQFNEFITQLAVDKRSALRDRSQTSYKHYRGRRRAHSRENPERTVAEAGVLNVAALVAPAEQPDLATSPANDGGEGAARYPLEMRQSNAIAEEFVLKNSTGLAVPDCYLPERFSNYSRRLLSFWGRILLELHRLFDVEGNFAIGFVIDEESEAEHEVSDRFGTVYYIAPCKVEDVQMPDGRTFRSLKKRFALTDRDVLIAYATHELVHGMGFRIHDEAYAAKFTEMMAVVMANRKRFSWCFAS